MSSGSGSGSGSGWDGGAPAPQVGWIKGRFFTDSNSDGTELNGGAVEHGIAGARIELLNLYGQVVQVDYTDHYGNYQFDVPDGHYRVKFPPIDGHVFTHKDVGGNDAIDSDVNAHGLTDVISVWPGMVKMDIDAGVKPAVGWVKGRLFNDQNFSDRDENEPGVADVWVALVSNTGAGIVAWTKTDANGAYQFDVPPDDYRVMFRLDDLVDDFVAATPNVGDDINDSDVVNVQDFGTNENGQRVAEATTESFTLAAGQMVSDVDAGLQQNVGWIKGRIFNDENLSNRDEGEAGFANVWVALVSTTGAGIVAWTKTDANGAYQFDAPADDYRVMFRIDALADEFVAATPNVGDDINDSDIISVNDFGINQNGQRVVEATTESFTIGAGQMFTDVDAGLQQAGGSISGRVFEDEDCDGLDGSVAIQHRYETVSYETFNNGADPAWFDIWTMQSNDGDGYLGGFGAMGHWWTDTARDFDLPEDAGALTITFDFLEIDSWDREPFFVFLNGERISLGHFAIDSHYGDLDGGTRTGEVTLSTGQRVTITVEDVASGDRGGIANSYWQDEVHKVTLVVEDPGGAIRLGFGSGLDEHKYNESWGVDNLHLVARIDERVETPETGAEGVTVALLDADGAAVTDADGQAITTVTDANGDYRFDGLFAGDYRVQVVAPDGDVFTTQNVGDDDRIDSDVGADGVSDIVSLGAGQSVGDVDAGLKPAPSSIAGRYFLDTDGDALDGGEPGVSGLIAVLLDDTGQVVLDEAGQPVFALTDATGGYSFSDLTGGAYRVGFAPLADADFVAQGADLDGDGESDDPAASDVDPDQSGQSVDLAGQSELVFVTDLFTLADGEDKTDVDAGAALRPGAISGRYFLDTDGDALDGGEPGVGGQVAILLNPDDSLALGADGQPIFAQTAADGSYRFDGVEAGDYRVGFAEADGLAFVAQGADLDGDGESDDPAASDVVNGRPGVTVDLLGLDAIEVFSTDAFTLAAGEDKTDIDAGAAGANAPPVALDDFDGPIDNIVFGDPFAPEPVIVTAADNALANDSDPDNDPITIIAAGADMTADAGGFFDWQAGSNGGEIRLNIDGTFQLRDPNFDFLGLTIDDPLVQTSIQYTIADSAGETDTAALIFEIKGVEEPFDDIFD